MPGIGPLELVIVAIIALLVLGPKRLPDAGRSLGRGMREFKNAIGGGSDDHDEVPEPRTARAVRAEDPAAPVAISDIAEDKPAATRVG